MGNGMMLPVYLGKLTKFRGAVFSGHTALPASVKLCATSLLLFGKAPSRVKGPVRAQVSAGECKEEHGATNPSSAPLSGSSS